MFVFPPLFQTIDGGTNRIGIAGNVIKTLKENGNQYTWGPVTVKLAEAYGFCWGVERAVQIAYEARKQFPEECIWLTKYMP